MINGTGGREGPMLTDDDDYGGGAECAKHQFGGNTNLVRIFFL